MNILIDENRIQSKISEMALEIDSYYKNQDWYQNTQEPVLIFGILTGAIFFMADLVRKLSIRTELDFIRISTYPGKSVNAQEPQIINMPFTSSCDRRVLLVEDILDTGKTLDVAQRQLIYMYKTDLKTAVLLRKPGKAPADVTADFVGFDIPDEFAVGMGLDYDGKYRELPYVAVWSEVDELETG